MSEPRIVDTKPHLLNLELGTYYWCACGKTGKEPFCDGSHKDSGLLPVKFEIESAKKVAICACRHTQNPPFCDGSHAKLK